MGTAWKQQQEANWNGFTGWAKNATRNNYDNAAKVFTGGAANSVEEGVTKVAKGENLDAAPPVPASTAPGAPDLTDDLVQKARMSMALRLQAARGRSSTFSSAPSMGSMGLSKPSLGGY